MCIRDRVETWRVWGSGPLMGPADFSGVLWFHLHLASMTSMAVSLNWLSILVLLSISAINVQLDGDERDPGALSVALSVVVSVALCVCWGWSLSCLAVFFVGERCIFFACGASRGIQGKDKTGPCRWGVGVFFLFYIIHIY